MTNQQSKTYAWILTLMYSLEMQMHLLQKLKKYAKQFSYSFLFNVPTTHQVDATNANLFAYSNSNHMLETWNRVTDKNIAINANEIWGMQYQTHGTNIFKFK